MITKKRTIGLLLIACLLTVGIVSVYAASPVNVKDAIQLLLGRVIAIEEKVDVVQFMETIANLQERIGVLEVEHAADIAMLEADIDHLQSQINTLSVTVDYIKMEDLVYLTYTLIDVQQDILELQLGVPDYDSGLYELEPYGEIWLDHNLGTHEILVYIIGGSYTPGDPPVWHPASGHKFTWALDSFDNDAILVINEADDWEDFRLLIWEFSESPWT